MATRLHYVKKAAKTYRGTGIKKGQPYYWYAFRYGPKIRSKSKPRRSALVRHEWDKFMLDLEDDVLALKVPDGTESVDVTEISSQLSIYADSVGDFKSELDERVSNMESAFPNGCPTLEMLTERVETLESLQQELDSAANDIEGEDGDTEESIETINNTIESINWS